MQRSSIASPSSQHRRGRSLGSAAGPRATEKDEDLTLFREMQRREREKRMAAAAAHCHPPISSRIYASSSSSSSSSAASAASRLFGGGGISAPSTRREPAATVVVTEDIFSADSGGKNDYDWLLTPPSTPLVANLSHHEPPRSVVRARPSTPTRTSPIVTSKNPPRANGMGSRSSIPTLSQRSSLPAPSSPSPIPKPRSRPSTPVGGRPSSIPSSAPPRSSSSRPSTPTRRPSTPNSNRSNHSATTTTTTTTNNNNTIARPSLTSTARPSSRSSSVTKTISAPGPPRSAPSSRGSSPARARPWQPPVLPGFSLEPPPNLRTSLPERRSSSNSRGSSLSARPGAPAMVSSATATTKSSLDPPPPPRRPASPSLTRGRSPSVERSTPNLSSSRASSKPPNGTTNAGGIPIVIDSKVVEKVMQARRAAALSQRDDRGIVSGSNTPVKRIVGRPAIPPAKDPSGFGRNLSRKSLDMALRHMDIRRSTPNGLRPLMSSVPASSIYSVRGGSVRSGCGSHSSLNSPLATSSNASSENSVSIVPDPEGSVDMGADAIKVSPPSMTHSDSVFSPSSNSVFSPSTANVKMISSWEGSPDYRDDSVEMMQLFRQEIERISSGCESPLVTQHGGMLSLMNCSESLDELEGGGITEPLKER